MLQTRYPTPDEFKAWCGIDLANMRDNANPSDEAQAFLARIEGWLSTLIDVECFRKVDFEYPTFTDYQKFHYKMAVMEQALYVFRNGDLSTDSGIDPDKGVVIPQDKLKGAVLAPNAKRELQVCGIWTKKIRFSDWRLGPGGYGGWWY